MLNYLLKEITMKNRILILCTLLFCLIIGCSKDDSSGDTTGIGGIGGDGGGGGTGNVTITVGRAQDDQGTIWFGFNPSVSVKVTSAVITQAQLGINQSVNNPNPNEEYAPLAQNSFYTFYQVPQEAQTGQKWTFRFTGTIVQGGQAFDKTVSFTYP
jgi:hypothetical protein